MVELCIMEGAPVMPSDSQVRVLVLDHAQHQDSTLYRLEKGIYLQFVPGPSLLGQKVTLYCNYTYPGDFIRDSYQALVWRKSQQLAGTSLILGKSVLIEDTDLFCEIYLHRPGSFHFYFQYDADASDTRRGSGYFLVAPTLRCGVDDDLPLDCVQCQTVLAKSLGPLHSWEAKLRVAKESGYNMVHFTPIQELGASNSSYSLAEQLSLNPLFSENLCTPATFDDVAQIVTKMKKEWKVVSICDIVLNHTANESRWLTSHPEATYNAHNCPHLRPAALLDVVLAKLTEDAARGEHEHCGVPRTVNRAHHLDAIKHLLLSDLLPRAKIHELYICNVNEVVQEFCLSARNKEALPESQPGELTIIQDPGYRRLKSTIDMELAHRLYNVYRSDCYDDDTRVRRCSEQLKNKLEQLNRAIEAEVWGHLTCAVDNCIAGMRYFRLQEDGPRIEEVSEKNPLVPSTM